MSSHFEEFEKLLADPEFWKQFWDDDLFLDPDIWASVSLFDTEDWETISQSWNHKDAEYKGNFLLAVGVPREVVRIALDLLNAPETAKVEEGLSLLAWNPQHASPYVGEADLEVFARVWREHSYLRDNLQYLLSRMGKSGQVRRLLGLELWPDKNSEG